MACWPVPGIDAYYITYNVPGPTGSNAVPLQVGALSCPETKSEMGTALNGMSHCDVEILLLIQQKPVSWE